MRILHLSDVYFPRINGVSTSIHTFRRGLAAHGIECTLIAPRYGDEPDAAGVLRLPARPVPGDPEDRLMSLGAALALTDTLRRRGYAAVHVQTPFVAHYAGARIARRLGVPLLLSYHTLFEEYLHHYVPLLPRALTAALARAVSRTQCRQAHRVIAPTEEMRERLAAYGIRDRVEVLPTGVPLRAFAEGSRARFRERHGIDGNRPVALYVGRLAHEKNIGFLIDAIGRARTRSPHLLLLVAGEGPAEAPLRARVAAAGLGGSVRFLGYLDRTRELPDCYAAADLFVFASRTETQGLVLLEAMASGVPVLALACMGTRSILASGLGSRTAPDDPAGFAQLLNILIAHPQQLARLGREARAEAARWSDDAMAGRLAALYRSAADATPIRPARRPPWKARSKGRPA